MYQNHSKSDSEHESFFDVVFFRVLVKFGCILGPGTTPQNLKNLDLLEKVAIFVASDELQANLGGKKG